MHNVYTNYELEWREPISDEKKVYQKNFKPQTNIVAAQWYRTYEKNLQKYLRICNMEVTHVIRGYSGTRISNPISNFRKGHEYSAHVRVFQKNIKKASCTSKYMFFGSRNANMKFNYPFLCALRARALEFPFLTIKA